MTGKEEVIYREEKPNYRIRAQAAAELLGLGATMTSIIARRAGGPLGVALGVAGEIMVPTAMEIIKKYNEPNKPVTAVQIDCQGAGDVSFGPGSTVAKPVLILYERDDKKQVICPLLKNGLCRASANISPESTPAPCYVLYPESNI